jgi:hypothetical protein
MSRETSAKARKMMEEPPDMPVRWTFAADKWDSEYARNVLLHFIKKQGLAKKCDEWVDKNFPSNRD